MQVKYTSHVQDEGWQDYKENGEISGTTGKNRKVEAIKIQLKNNPEGTGIRYRTYIANSGWQNWAQDFSTSGTIGQNKKIYGKLETREIYAQAIIDYISGMTDRYAIEIFNELLRY